MKTSSKLLLGGAVGAALGAYLLSLRGRTGNPVLPKLQNHLYAHRGYYRHPDIPENSIPAFRRALERGWGAEFDVHLLRDGTLAVLHDSDLKRMTGVEGKIEDLDLAELTELRLLGTQERIPTFNQVLALFDGRVPLIIELKSANGNHAALAEAVCKRLDRYEGVFCLESFDPRVLDAVKKLRPDFCRGQLARNFFRDPFGLTIGQQLLGTNLSFNFLTRPDFIAYCFQERKQPANLLSKNLWGIRNVGWTIRTPEELRQCRKEGIIPIFEGFDPEAEEN